MARSTNMRVSSYQVISSAGLCHSLFIGHYCYLTSSVFENRLTNDRRLCGRRHRLILTSSVAVDACITLVNRLAICCQNAKVVRRIKREVAALWIRFAGIKALLWIVCKCEVQECSVTSSRKEAWLFSAGCITGCSLSVS